MPSAADVRQNEKCVTTIEMVGDLERGKNGGELRDDTDPELLNDSIFGAIYYRLLLQSGPLTRRFGEELVEQVLRGNRAGRG